METPIFDAARTARFIQHNKGMKKIYEKHKLKVSQRDNILLSIFNALIKDDPEYSKSYIEMKMD